MECLTCAIEGQTNDGPILVAGTSYCRDHAVFAGSIVADARNRRGGGRGPVNLAPQPELVRPEVLVATPTSTREDRKPNK